MNDNIIRHKTTRESFNYDKVYGPEMETKELFDSEAKSLVLSALNGYNVTIFAYG